MNTQERVVYTKLMLDTSIKSLLVLEALVKSLDDLPPEEWPDSDTTALMMRLADMAQHMVRVLMEAVGARASDA